jgi:hypothetical protein
MTSGYKDRMDTFFSFIPGMSSRIGNHVDFPNYETDELVDIAKVHNLACFVTLLDTRFVDRVPLLAFLLHPIDPLFAFFCCCSLLVLAGDDARPAIRACPRR